MRPLVTVLCHDRPEALKDVLASLAFAGAAEVLLSVDSPEPGVLEVVRSSGHPYLEPGRLRLGIGASLNRVQAFRKPGQDFFRLDGDTLPVTRYFVSKLQAQTAILRASGGQSGGICHPSRYNGSRAIWWPPGAPYNAKSWQTYGSAAYVSGTVLDTLGFWRSTGGGYDIEDWDMWYRAELAGFPIVYAPDVYVLDWAPPVRKIWSSQNKDKTQAERRKVRDSRTAMNKEHRGFLAGSSLFRSAAMPPASVAKPSLAPYPRDTRGLIPSSPRRR